MTNCDLTQQSPRINENNIVLSSLNVSAHNLDIDRLRASLMLSGACSADVELMLSGIRIGFKLGLAMTQ